MEERVTTVLEMMIAKWSDMKIMCKDMVTSMLVAVSIIGCSSNADHPHTFLAATEHKVEVIFEPSGPDHEKVIPLHSIFDKESTTFISLKSNQNGDGLLEIPTTFTPIDQSWLVFDPFNKTSNLLLYDQKGDFVRCIGKKGKGRGEYIESGHCRVNYEKKRIEVVDGSRNHIVFYDYGGQYISSSQLPMIFTDLIYDPSSAGYYLYTLDNYNTGFMPAYSLDKDYVIVKADGEFQPIHGIEEITLDQTSNPYRNNGNKLFYYQKSVGFINNYSNDLYLIQEDGIQNLVSFEFNGVKFQPKEYIKNADGIRFLKTLENGFSFVSDLSITNSHIVETISVSSENPSRKYDDIYLFYDMNSKDLRGVQWFGRQYWNVCLA